NRRIVSFGIVMLCIAITVPLIAAGQGQAPAAGGGQREGRGGGGGRGGAPAPPPTNLQVLPKDWTRQQVVQVMQQFTMGLGVMCNYCHAEMAGAHAPANGQRPLDPPSGEQQTKQTPPVIVRDAGGIKRKLYSELGK